MGSQKAMNLLVSYKYIYFTHKSKFVFQLTQKPFIVNVLVEIVIEFYKNKETL